MECRDGLPLVILDRAKPGVAPHARIERVNVVLFLMYAMQNLPLG